MAHAKIPKEKVACIDTCFVQGDFLKLAREYKKGKSKRKINYKIKIKPTKRLKDILDTDTRLFITPITKYELLEKLIFAENLSFNDANHIYLTIFLKQYKNLLEIKGVDAKILSDKCITSTLSKLKKLGKIELSDVINIEIAKKAEMPIITSERTANVWKSLYKKALSEEEAWRLFKSTT